MMNDTPTTDAFSNWNPDLRFDLQEAIALINHEVINTSDHASLPKPPIDKLGVVVGILTLNEEIEILIRIDDSLQQICKTEFNADFILVPDEC